MNTFLNQQGGIPIIEVTINDNDLQEIKSRCWASAILFIEGRKYIVQVEKGEDTQLKFKQKKDDEE